MSIFKEIKERVSMVEICSMLGLTPNKSGFIPCPHHAERTPSCKIYPTSFYCFSCNQGGDAIQLVADSMGISPLQASREIDNYFSLGLFEDKGEPAPRKSRTPKPVSFEQFNSIYRMVTLDILAEICRKVWQAEGDSENYRLIEQIHQSLLESKSSDVNGFKKEFGKEVAKIVNQYS